MDKDVITIDSKNSTDFDDALGVTYIEDKITSVYALAMCLWLDTLNLWDSSKNATIYLPEKKTYITDNIIRELMWLIENTVRYV